MPASSPQGNIFGCGGERVASFEAFGGETFASVVELLDYRTFEHIRKAFNGTQFECGDLSFSRDGSEIEIMVEKSGTRLPISRLGSGHQQILYVIATLAANSGKMLGIEELEINLSPPAQKAVFETIRAATTAAGPLNQVLITSHSRYLGNRRDVRWYGVTHDGFETKVEAWREAQRDNFFGVAGLWDHD